MVTRAICLRERVARVMLQMRCLRDTLLLRRCHIYERRHDLRLRYRCHAMFTIADAAAATMPMLMLMLVSCRDAAFFD